MQNRIKARRKQLRLTQEQLAEKAQISRPHLADIESGKAVPSVVVAQKIAHVLKRTTDHIFFTQTVV